MKHRVHQRAAIIAAAVLAAMLNPRSNLLVSGQDLEPQAADGSLDPSFGSGGKLTTDFSGRADFAHALAIQSDGRILLAGGRDAPGSAQNFALARYSPNGTLDNSYGSGGKVTTDFFGSGSASDALVVQTDGKAVAAGAALDSLGNGFWALARFNPDGSLDASFGSGGKVTTDLTSGAEAIAISPNAKLVVAGTTEDQKGEHFAICRFNPDGSLDTSFGAGGKVINSTIPGAADAIALQSDGKIVIGGSAVPDPAKPEKFALLRYNADGSPDTSFGTGGVAITDFFATGDSTVRGVAIQSDGKIVAAGIVQLGASVDSRDFGLARFNPDGTLDTSFSGGGLFAANSATGLDSERGRDTVALVHPLGTITTDFFGHADGATALAIQGDGKIVAVGGTHSSSSTDSDEFAIARYNPDGSLDSTFGSGGKQVTDFFGHLDEADAVAITPNGQIVTAGLAESGSVFATADFAMARYIVASGFTLGFDQPTITADRGTKVPIRVLVNRIGGFSGNVTVTPPDLSAIGVKVKPPDPISTTDTSIVVKLKIKGSATPGGHQLTFTGRDDAGTTHTASLILNIN